MSSTLYGHLVKVAFLQNVTIEYWSEKYENNLDKFDIGHCRIRVTVTVGFEIFLHLSQYKLSGSKTLLWYKLGSLY